MTQAEAEETAQKLWGGQAFILIDENGTHIVGEVIGPFRQKYGQGSSWEKAFTDAKYSLN